MSDLQRQLAVAVLHPGSIGLLVNCFNRRSARPFEPTASQVFCVSFMGVKGLWNVSCDPALTLDPLAS